MIVDVHTHLDHPLISKDIDNIISRAKLVGVKKILTSGINPSTNREALRLSEKYDLVECTLGFYPQDALIRESEEESYPNDAKGCDVDEEINFIEQNKDKNIGIGEIGLDYYNGRDKESQKKDFIKMIKLSKKINKPIIIHSRKAELDTIEILEEYECKKVVMHCFSGKKALIKRCIDNRWFFSVPTNIVRAQNFQILVDMAPLSQIFTETDAPFLSPFKEKLNESSFIVESIKMIAQIKKMDETEVKNIIYMNYLKLFT